MMGRYILGAAVLVVMLGVCADVDARQPPGRPGNEPRIFRDAAPRPTQRYSQPSPPSMPRGVLDVETSPAPPIPATTAALAPEQNIVDGESSSASPSDALPSNEALREEFSNLSDDLQFEAETGEIEEEGASGLIGGSCLHDLGPIQMEYLYTGDIWNNMRGGMSTHKATTYFGLYEMAMVADLEGLGCPLGGTFFFYALNAHGRGISEYYVGDAQGICNIEIPFEAQIFQMEEFWYEKEILDGDIVFRIGKLDANYDFAVLETGGDFLNSSFGMHHNIPMPSYPDAAMGVVTQFQLTDSFLLRTGVWDGEAIGKTWGFNSDTTFSMFEFEKAWEIDGHPGEFHVGMWYHSGDWDYIDGSGTHAGNHGVHLGAEHLIYRENPCAEDDYQGLAMFAQWGWAPEAYSDVTQYFGTGLVYRGFVPCRDDDVLGAAMAYARFSDAAPDMTDENAIEVFYKAAIGDYISIQPDLQYIVSPGGQYRDAFAAGLRFQILL